ncbi:hypothetical protein PVAP13_8NG265201 [Panicum virgatum]|uniref:Dirigent protein n=1 Tax=Panicum virgatum TaxID=38727 RepID=A0A8T0PCA8_PANVG|nr:hypothetical protein PVAP13_8NG265201 [Panicum virgatum]
MGNNEYNLLPEKTGLPNRFGQSNVIDWDIHDAPDTSATVVARLQGLAIAAGKSIESWYSSFNVVFTDQRFVIFGATGDYGGHTVVASLTIVTNVKTYGPYGKQSAGHTAFHIAAPNNHIIVGLYGRAGDVVDQIGAYMCPN